MGIDIETFEETPERELGELSNPEKVLQFLLSNDDKAFKAAEIADRTGINPNSIATVLGRLEDRDLVRHKAEYWAIGDPERIESFGQYRRVTKRMNERYGVEDPEAWREHAAEPPTPERDE